MMKTSELNGKALEPTSNTPQDAPETVGSLSDDFSHALTSARIACYDDFRSAPRVTEIAPNTTAEFIESLASTIYTQAQQTGGSIPYTVIREVSENFIHARFCEIVVSIYDGGNTIRFSDQGPGIPQKEKAQMPGFSSATDPMKRYIRGVGSGLPLVKEYLSFSHGRIAIEDNLRAGAVVTISVAPGQDRSPSKRHTSTPQRNDSTPRLTDREKDILRLLMQEESLRLTDIKNDLGLSPSTAHRILGNLEEAGLVESVGKIRCLTDFGLGIAEDLF